MFLTLSSSMWAGRPLVAALDAARPTGIRSLELAASPDCPHVDPAGETDEVRSLLDDWNVAALTAGHPDLARREDEGGEEAVEHVLSTVRAARKLGARVVSVSLGSTEVDAWESAWARAITALRMILHRTANSGARLAVELHADDVLNSQKKLRRLLEEIPDRRLGVTLDTAYLYYLRIPIPAFLEIAGERLYHVQLRDATRSDFNRGIGEGEIHFPATFRALRAHGYAGALSLELKAGASSESIESGVTRLHGWLREICSGGEAHA